VEIGPRDIAENAVFVGRRDQAHRQKTSIQRDVFVNTVGDLLDEIQQNIFRRAEASRNENTREIDDREDFYRFFTPTNVEKPEIHGGFALSHWCGDASCEAKIKEELAVTIRCIPLDNPAEKGRCICCGKPSGERVVFAKAY
jgi:prolyl-tRNA synthetase